MKDIPITSPELKAEWMQPGERSTVPCVFPFVLDSPIASGNIGIIVTFRVRFVPLKTFSRTYRFVTLPGSDGHLYWFPQPATQ